MLVRTLFLSLVLAVCFAAAGETPWVHAADNGKKLVVYTSRTSKTDAALMEQFSKETGIAVTLVSGKAKELLERLKEEGAVPQADLFITVDGGLLDAAKQQGSLQPMTAAPVLANVPAALRDKDNQWIGLSTRARVIVYSKERVTPEQLSTYEDLADPKWKGKVVMRPSAALYDQSLLASLIALDGEAAAADWVKGMAANFARPPKGNDRAQAKDIASGTGDVTLMNTYYLGRMLNGSDPEERKAAQSVGVFFPNQKTTGTHINICGIALVKDAPNKADAEKLIAWLTDVPRQEALAAGNYEYPVNPKAKKPDLLKQWGDFKVQALDFSILGRNNAKARELFSKGGWE